MSENTTKEKKPAGKADKKAPEKKTDKTGDTATASDATAKDPAKSYSRGENQKPVSPQYRRNWDAIFGKRK